MKPEIKLSDSEQKKVCEFLKIVLTQEEVNRQGLKDQLEENWTRHFSKYSCKKDKDFPFVGSADIQTGVIEYSDSTIEARFNAAVGEIELTEFVGHTPKGIEAAEIIGNYFNHFWRKKTKVDKVLIKGFQYDVVEGTITLKIRPIKYISKKIKRYGFVDETVGNIKKRIYKVLGKDLAIEDGKKEIAVGAIWENVPLINFGFDSDSDDIQKGYFTYEKIKKSYSELKRKEREEDWFNADKLKEDAKDKKTGQPVSIEEDEDVKRDYQGFNETRTNKFDLYEFWITYDAKDDGKEQEWYFIYNQEKDCLHYYNLNQLFDKRKPYVTAPFYLIAGKLTGQSQPQRLGPLNDELDTLHNDIINNNTLNNTMNGFYIPIKGFNPDKFELAPGRFRAVNANSVKDLDSILKVVQMGNKQLDLKYQEDFVLSLLERKSLVADYSMGRESSINKKATASGTAMLLEQFQVTLDPLIKNLQEAVKDGIIQTAQCLYEYMPSAGIQFWVGKKEMTLKREHLEYIDEMDIFVLKNAVSVMIEKEKQIALLCYDLFKEDESGEINKYEVKKYLLETLNPVLKERFLRMPEEIQMIIELKQKEQQLAEYEQALAEEANELQQEKDKLLLEKLERDEEEFRQKLDANTNLSEEQKEQMLQEFRDKYLEAQVADEEE